MGSLEPRGYRSSLKDTPEQTKRKQTRQMITKRLPVLSLMLLAMIAPWPISMYVRDNLLRRSSRLSSASLGPELSPMGTGLIQLILVNVLTMSYRSHTQRLNTRLQRPRSRSSEPDQKLYRTMIARKPLTMVFPSHSKSDE